jgi:hypothetical protein
VHDAVGAHHVQFRVVGALLNLGDLYAAERPTEPDDEALAQVVREGTFPAHVFHLHQDGIRLGRTDPDREEAITALLPEDYDVTVRRTVESQALNENFDHIAVTLRSGPD